MCVVGTVMFRLFTKSSPQNIVKTYLSFVKTCDDLYAKHIVCFGINISLLWGWNSFFSAFSSFKNRQKSTKHFFSVSKQNSVHVF